MILAQDEEHSNMPALLAEKYQKETSSLIYGAVYSGVAVYEMMCRNIAVMRRKDDSYLNATQILKVAGIDKGRRTKILEKEILTGVHEKVQGGYGKYQGTWIPFERGVQLAKQYHVDSLLRPLLEFQIQQDTPSKEDYLAAQRRNQGERDKRPYVRKVIQQSKKLPEFHLPPEHQEHLNKKFKFNEFDCQINPKEPMSAEATKNLLVFIFTSEDPQFIPPELLFSHPGELDFNIVIDEQGNTAVHWAAALARIDLLSTLIQKGANPAAVNDSGETCLMRAVQVTNNYDCHSFNSLLDLLVNTIEYRDKKQQTVFHHICTSAGLKHRTQSSRYYLECLLTRMNNSGMPLFPIIDALDYNGDSSLLISARVGHQQLVDQLVEIGADTLIVNKAGLRLADFGYEHLCASQLPDTNEPVLDIVTQTTELTEKLKQGLTREQSELLYQLLNEASHMSSERETLLRDKLAAAARQSKEMAKELVHVRRHNSVLRQEQYQVPELIHRAQLLEKCLQEQVQQNERETLLYQRALKSEPIGLEYHQELSHLRALLDAKENMERRMSQEIIELKTNQTQTERYCKRIIANCCNIPIENVDSLLIPLLNAVESDDIFDDIGPVAQFMSRVKQQDLINNH